MKTPSAAEAGEDGEGDPEADNRQLLAAAREVAVRRVVVKRPRRAQKLADGVSYTVLGSTVRWDVYLTA